MTRPKIDILVIDQNFAAIKSDIEAIINWIANKLGRLGDKTTSLWDKIPGHGLFGQFASGLTSGRPAAHSRARPTS
jgi:hypothetical protein